MSFQLKSIHILKFLSTYLLLYSIYSEVKISECDFYDMLIYKKLTICKDHQFIIHYIVIHETEVV